MRAAAKPMTILMALPEAHLEMEAEDLTSDALLGARVAKRATQNDLEATPLLLEQTQLPSLTVTPVQSGSSSGCSPPESTVQELPGDVKRALERRRDDKKKLEEKGLRGKFLKYLEVQAGRKRESLNEVRRRSMCESDSEIQVKLHSISDKLSDDLESLEELLRVNRDALIHEHLELVLDRSICSPPSNDSVGTPASSSSTESDAAPAVQPASPAHAPPTHWRSRVIRRTPYQTRKSITAVTADSCGSSCSNLDSKRQSGESTASKASVSRRSMSVAYCEKVSKGVTPVMTPIDRALGRISNLVYGPTPTRSIPSSPATPSAPHLPPRPQHRSEATLRKEIVRDFWGYVSCGNCVVVKNNSMNVPLSSDPTRAQTQKMQEEAIRVMEKRIEADVQASLAKFKSQVAESQAARARPPALAEVGGHVPSSSLQVSMAVDKTLAQRDNVAESVVEMHSSGGAKMEQDATQVSMEQTRQALYKSLGSSAASTGSFKSSSGAATTPTIATTIPTAIPARLCRPLPDPDSPTTPMSVVVDDTLSPVSQFFHVLEAKTVAEAAAVGTTDVFDSEDEFVRVSNSELCGDLTAQNSLEFANTAQWRASPATQPASGTKPASGTMVIV